VKSVQILLEHPDTNANLKVKDQVTPLMAAAGLGYLHIVKILLAWENIDLYLKDESGQLDMSVLAVYVRHEECWTQIRRLKVFCLLSIAWFLLTLPFQISGKEWA